MTCSAMQIVGADCDGAGRGRQVVTVINCIGIFGTAFGLLVTMALLVGYVDAHRVDKGRFHDADDPRRS